MNNIKISYKNLGTYVDKETGEVKPVLPKNNSHLDVVDFKEVWCNQLKLDKNAPKGTSGMIFPFALDTLYEIEKMKEDGICSNGLIFVDIDCGEEAKQIIVNAMDKKPTTILSAITMNILTACTTRKGLHIIFLSNPLTCNEYKMEVFIKLSTFAWAVKEVCGIDLRDIHGALDACTFSMKQRLFLRYTDWMFWNDHVQKATWDNDTWKEMKKEYPGLWEKVDKSANGFNIPAGLKIHRSADVLAINPQEPHEYIEHHLRWRLFDSLCCIFAEDENELWKQWNRCCDMIEPKNHSTEWFKAEPKRNKWLPMWLESRNHWYDEDMLVGFGYILGSQHVQSKTIMEMPENIDELMDLTFKI